MNTRQSLPSSSLLILLATTVVGCGSPSTQPGGTGKKLDGVAPGKLDACALITKADVEAVLGAPVKEPTHGMENEGSAKTATISECRYDSAPESGTVSTSVFVRRSPVEDNTPSSIESVRTTVKEMAGSDPLAVPGLGDSAFWSGKRLGQLHVFKSGNWYLIISVNGFADDSIALEKAKLLAQKVLSRLGG